MANVRRTSVLEASWLRPLAGQGLASQSPAVVCLRLTGDLDVAAARQALEALSARHDTLRSCYRSVEEASWTDEAVVDVDVVDARSWTEAAVLDAMRSRLEQRFLLAEVPLWRSMIVRTADQETVVGLTFDMLIADPMSVGILVRDFAAGYDHAVATGVDGRTAATRPGRTYAVFADRQRAELGEPDGVKPRFWRHHSKRFGPYPPLSDLGAGVPRRGSPGPVQTVFEMRIPDDEDADLGAFCRQQRLTRFAVVAAALLSRSAEMAGSEAPGLVTDMPGRAAAADWHTAGLFFHGLPVHLSTPAAARGDLATASMQVQDTIADVTEHSMPLRATPDAAKNGLVRVGPGVGSSMVLNVSDVRGPDLPAMAGLKVERFHLRDGRLGWRGISSPNLLVDWRYVESGPRLVALCDPALFDPNRVADLLIGATDIIRAACSGSVRHPG